MKTYVLRRLLALLPVALVVATVAFILIHLAPGDPASVIAGPDATRADVERIEKQLGLDAPMPVQLVRWFGRLVQGDLGQSIFLRKPVTEAILDRVEPTLLLTLFAIVISIADRRAGRRHLGPLPQHADRSGAHGHRAPRGVDPQLPAGPALHPVLLGVARLVPGGRLLAAGVRAG